MSIRSPLQLLTGLLLAVILLFSASAGKEKAMAAGVCDSLRVTLLNNNTNECCFGFNFTKLNSGAVTRIVVIPSGASVTHATRGSVGSSVTYDSTQATFSYTTGMNGMPRGVDSAARICFNSARGVFTVLIRWYNGNQQLCQDSMTLRCQSTPPPPQGCFDILRDTVRCGKNGVYTYTFYVQNRSSSNGSTLTLHYNDPLSGITVSPTSFNLGTLAPNATGGPYTINVSGSLVTTGRHVVLIGTFCSAPFVSWDSLKGRIDTTVTCCTDSLNFVIPNCGSTGSNCFTVDSSRTNCLKSGFSWCFMVRNNSSRNVNEIDVTSGTNGQTTTIPISPALAPGGWRDVCVTLSGGTPGSLITNTLRLCNVITEHDTVRRNDSNWTVIDTVIGRECCTDTFSIRVPQCGNTTGCISITEAQTSCDSVGARLCFTVTNNASYVMRTLTLAATTPSGTTISPSTVLLSPPLAPGASRNVCVLLVGPNVQTGGAALLSIRACDSTMQYCCTDSLTVKLPQCGEPMNDCCSAFRKAFSRLAGSGSSSGFGALNGWLSAGPGQMKKISAEIVSATINGQPVYAYMNFGLIYNGFGVGAVNPYLYGSEVIWQSGTGVNMNTLTQFYLSLKFPQMAANASRDTVRYCVKFRYTDVNCVTCDTTICFTTVRLRFSGNNYLGRTMKKENGGNTLGASNAGVTGSLDGSLGTMKIVFPTAPPELGAVNYVGVRIALTDKSMKILSAASKDPSYSFTVMNGWAMSSFPSPVKAGAEMDVDLTYSDLLARKSLEHQVALMYTLPNDPNSILEEDYVVTLSGDTGTKDSLTATHAGLTDAYTFAVHLSNANGANESIAKMVITTTDPVKIVAVGPTSSDTRALLQFGTLTSGNTPRNFVGEIVDGGQVAIAPSTEYGPIYLTLVGRQGETFAPTIHFATLNSNDQVISEGDLTLSDPSAGVTHGVEGETVTGAMLRQSFPNPSSGETTIQFHLPHDAQNVSLVITDVKGSEVARPINGESMTTGEHAVYLSTGNLPAGTYYYTLRVGNAVETKSMQIVK